MDVIDNEVKEIIGSLHLKEVVLQELANDAKQRMAYVRALREKFEEAINDGPEKE